MLKEICLVTQVLRQSLKIYQTQLLNPCGDLVLRSHNKGNRFAVIDKETDKLKAKEQIKVSSFVKLSIDSTFDHIGKVKVWDQKWYAAGEISKELKIIYTLRMLDQVKTLRYTRHTKLAIPYAF